MVSFFHARPHFRADLRDSLATNEDTGRIVQKFLLGRGDASDLLALNTTIRSWSVIAKTVGGERRLEASERKDFNKNDWASIDALMSRVNHLHDLSEMITAALGNGQAQVIDDSGEASSNVVWKYGMNKWTIKPEWVFDSVPL